MQNNFYTCQLCLQVQELATAGRGERAEAKYQEGSVLEMKQKKKDAASAYKWVIESYRVICTHVSISLVAAY